MSLNVDKENSTDERVLEADKFGYRSLHYVISLSKDRLKLTENRIYTNLKGEIQIRSILQHAWAEIEHDIGYKGENEKFQELQKEDFIELQHCWKPLSWQKKQV